MVRITDIVEQLPEMMFGDELLTALAVIPEYDDDIVNKSAAERLRRLWDAKRWMEKSQQRLLKKKKK